MSARFRRKSIGIGISLLVAVGGIAAVAIALAIAGGSTPTASAKLAARSQVVLAKPVNGTRASQLVILNPDTGKQREIGEADSYSHVRWSPDGSMIAALATPTDAGQTSRLHLIAMPGGAFTTRELYANSVFVSWSPTSKQIAVVGQHVYLLGPDGSVLADVPAPERGGGASTEVIGAGFAWSPDGNLSAAGVNGMMIVIGRDGAVFTKTLASMTGGTSDFAAIAGWLDDATVVVSTSDGNFAIRASAGELTARKMANTEPMPSNPRGNREPDPAAVVAVKDLIPGGTVTQSRASADGAADVLEVRSSSGDAHLVIRDRAAGEIFEAKDSPVDLRGGGLYDVYVAAR
jgi:dipeptidyl aminopeptidase/acylaminoacyl peptidase